MTEAEKKKLRAKAAKLSNPKPRELPSGAWRCEVKVNGERISVVDDDPTVAHAKVNAIRAGLVKQKNKDTLTVKEAGDKYIKSREKSLSPPTIRAYKINFERHGTDLHGKKVMDVDEADLQEEIAKLQEKELSVKSIKNIIGFYIAVITMYKPINPKKLSYGQRIKKEHAFLEEQEIVDLISAAEGDEFEVPILLGLWLGMRRSEICGLSWECVDFDSKTISVVATMLSDSENKYSVVQRTKTESSRRVIKCPTYILEKLKQYQPKPEKRVGLIFDFHPNSIYRAVKRVSEKAGVKFVGVHGLRHTNATVMATLNIVDKAALARGGWSSDKIFKDVYRHMFDSSVADADQKVDAYFQDKVEKGRTEVRTENDIA